MRGELAEAEPPGPHPAAEPARSGHLQAPDDGNRANKKR
jgi:hypothetical protein